MQLQKKKLQSLLSTAYQHKQVNLFTGLKPATLKEGGSTRIMFMVKTLGNPAHHIDPDNNLHT